MSELTWEAVQEREGFTPDDWENDYDEDPPQNPLVQSEQNHG